jgi:pyridoxine 5'-phosphate synthase PdxJ
MQALRLGVNLDHFIAVGGLGAPLIKLHTGRYCNLEGTQADVELERTRTAARHAADSVLG